MPTIPTVVPHTVVLKGNLDVRHEEYRAASAITPGHLVKLGSGGTVAVHGTAGGKAAPTFAKEDYLQGKTIDQAYAANDPVFIHHAQPGDVIYALLPASASAIVKGDELTSSGDGTVKKGNGSTEWRVAYSEEAVDNSANAAGPVRIKIRVDA